MINPVEVVGALASTAIEQAQGDVRDATLDKRSGWYSHSRLYRVYLPVDYNRRRRYPLVMVLHGCRQSHLSIQSISAFDAIADREKFVVVYPYATVYRSIRSRNCWGWWQPRHRQRGHGEVADLSRIAEQVCNDYSIDSNRLHVCGLSSGAAMSVASLVAYGDTWRSGASVAGVPYGESARSVRISQFMPVRHKSVETLVRILRRELRVEPPPLLIIQSRADKVVGSKSAENLRDSWLQISGAGSQPDVRLTGKVHAVQWELNQYSDSAKQLRVAFLQLDKLTHGWPGGLPGNFSIPKAPNVSELIWAFFKQS